MDAIEPPLDIPTQAHHPDTIHDVESAAERCKTTPKVILEWIREGLPAAPQRKVGARGPRRYCILDADLVAWIMARRQRLNPAAVVKRKPGRPKKGSPPQTGRVLGPRP